MQSATYKFDVSRDHREVEEAGGTAVAELNHHIGWTYFTPTSSSASVIIKSYRRSQGEECDAKALGCTGDGEDTTFPHFGKDRDLWIPFPPATNAEWTDDIEKWEDDPTGTRYLPEVIIHELGHVMGLGHLEAWANAIMRLGYVVHMRIPTPTEEDVRGFEIVTAPHVH